MILAKCLCLYGEPQWGVVGDTFPVGCAWSDQIVFHERFAANPDRHVPLYQSKYGIYEPGCGLENLHLSFGHDGYIAEVMKPYLPDEALYMLALPLLLPLASPGCVQVLRERERQGHASLGVQVQPL